jgi:uncharacterized NAD(P)/FAD-binding protein YdhS
VRKIAIIGAGLSGKLLALNLLRLSSAGPPVEVRLLDRRDEASMGPAYSGDEDFLLLNVPAGRMGALAEDPEHFLRWVRARGGTAGQWDFLPRRLYREYILALLREGLQARPEGAIYEHICGEAGDIEIEGRAATVRLSDRPALVVDRVVLALGNFPPRDPPVQNRSALASPRYVRDPWDLGILNSLSPEDAVLLIGTGQTTVDALLALHRRAHRGRIIALSRRGLLPLVHRGFETYDSFYDEVKGSKSIREIFRIVRRHFERAGSLGMDVRSVTDSLRPDTQTIWMALPEEEKQRFMRHLYRYWEIIRSRIAPENEAVIEAMRASGQLEIRAGQIRDLVDTGAALEVRYVRPGQSSPEVETAALVINTTGPEADYRRVDHPLVQNLMRRGLIRPGPAGLGLDGLPNGAVIGQNGLPSDVLFTLGPTLRGVLWESLSVIEIRVQAERLARTLLE